MKAHMNTYIVRSRLGCMKVRWLKWPPHVPSTIDMLSENCLSCDWVDVKLMIIGGFKVGHLKW